MRALGAGPSALGAEVHTCAGASAHASVATGKGARDPRCERNRGPKPPGEAVQPRGLSE